MKKITFILWFLFFGITFKNHSLYANEPDSAYVFAYGTNAGDGKGGLYFAWSLDQKQWHSIGNGYSFLNSDFGT
ncbi:MAG TPA: hypothetical protein PKA53_06450, partial [Sphingobacterium sp.]|nr:hypothetical protein [Sphingobacterium sp.]